MRRGDGNFRLSHYRRARPLATVYSRRRFFLRRQPDQPSAAGRTEWRRVHRRARSAAKSGKPGPTRRRFDRARRRRRDASGRGRRCAGADDAAGRAGRRRPELAASRRARADRCSRTSISARRSSTSTTSAFPSASCMPAATARTATSRTTSRSPTSPAPICSSGRREDAGLRPLLDRRRQQGLGRPGARRARLRGQALHQGRQLGPRRQQHPGVLHPGRDQVSRSRPRREAGAGPRLSAGADGARQFLGLHLADARKACT